MLAESLTWWLAIQAAGLIALPIAFVLFQRLPSLGYALAKPLGLLLVGYLFWLMLSLDVMSNRPGSIVLCYLLLAAVSALIVRRNQKQMIEQLDANAGLIIATELVFGISFAVAVYLKSFVPEISATEKPMDFMMLNSVWRSEHFPPSDAWLAGFDVSYYYFGYVIQAMTGKIAAVTPSVAFNLGLASTAALAATAAFGLGYDLCRCVGRAKLRSAIGVGAAAALLVTVLGNLEGVLEFMVANGSRPAWLLDWIGINGLDEAAASATWYPSDQSSFWWWWRATRISADGGSITEFPFFSFLLGDLHPHVMALPYVLLAIGAALAFWLSPSRLDETAWKRQPLLLVLTAIVFGGLGFLNTWDLPTFGFLLLFLVAVRNLTLQGTAQKALRDTAAFFLPLALLAVALYLPFYLSFSSQAAGLETVATSATRPVHAALFWAPLFVLVLPLPVVVLARLDGEARTRWLGNALALPLAVLAVWLFLTVVGDGFSGLSSAVDERGSNWLTAAFFAGCLTLTLAALAALVVQSRETNAEGASEANPRLPVLAMTATAFLLILGAEFFYVQDVFGSRLNTVFKLYYQAWPLLAISGAFSAWLTVESLRSGREPLYEAPRDVPRSVGGVGQAARLGWLVLAAVVVAGALLYPLGATLSRTDGLSASVPRTLDGTAFVRNESEEDYAALNWLRDRTAPFDVLAEATGGQYSAAARMSSRSGVPAVIGWSGHEVQWGRDGQTLAQRKADIDQAYTTTSLPEALSLLRKYGVTLVYVGGLERATYPAEGLEKFRTGLAPAFEFGGSTLYRVPPAVDESPLLGTTP